MDSQQVRNLQEAYIGVYDGDIREKLEFETWVNNLLDEGYDLSDYNWDEMYEIYNEDYKGGPAFGMKYSKPKPLSGEKGDGSGYGPPEKFTKPDDKIEKPGTTVPPFKKGGYGRIMSNIPHGIGDHRDKTASRITTIIGKDPGAPTSQKMAPKEKKKPSLEIIRKKKIQDSYDLYDTILSHLMNEGYADTVENAESIMVNMSENWRESILSEEPVQDYRDMKRADQNRSGIRGREFTHDTRSGLKGIPQSGSAASGGKSPAPAGSGSIRSMPSPGPVGSGSIRSMPSPGPVGSGSIGGRPSPPPVDSGSIRSMPSPPSGGNGGTKYTTPTKDGSAGSITINKNIPGDDFIGPTVSRGGNTYGIPNPKFGRPQR